MCLFRHGRVGAYYLRWHQAKGKCLGETDQGQGRSGEGEAGEGECNGARLSADEGQRGVIQPSHNGQIAVDDKERVIVAADVSQNATDHAEFKPMVEQVERNLGGFARQLSGSAGRERRMKWNGRKPSMNLRSLVKVRGEFSLMCLAHNVKRVVKRVLDGTVSLPGKYARLIEEAVLGNREKQLTWSGLRCKISPQGEQKGPKGSGSLQEITILWCRR